MRYSRLFLFMLIAFLGLEALVIAGNGKHHDFKTEGYIQSIGADSIVVNDFIFNVDSTTNVRAENGSSFSYADLQENDYVKIEGYALGDSSGRYFASQIKLKQAEQNDSLKIKARGVISALTDSTFDVSGYTFWVDSATTFMGHNDSLISFSDLTEGTNVEVEAYQNNAGNYVAQKVKIESSSSKKDGEEFDFSGIIDSLATDGFAMNQRFFSVDSLTKYKMSHDQPASFSDLSVGSAIELEALQFTDGSFYAKKVEIKNQSENYLEFTGRIDSIGTDFIVVAGYTVQIDSATRINGSGNTTLAFSDLQKGQKVKVKGVETTPNTVTAAKIKVYEFQSNKDHFKGHITAIGVDFLQVDQRSFSTDSLTEYRDSLGQRSDWTAFSNGDYVKVEARVQPDGSWYAKEVKQKHQKSAELEFSGTIDSLFSGAVRVSGNIFWIDSLTQVYDLQDYPMSADSLGLGDGVEVNAAIQPDGSFKALQIKQENRPDLIRVDGTVDAVSDSAIWISGPEFHLSQRSVVLDKNYAQLNSAALNPGDPVTLWALPSNTASPTVLQIQLTASSVTGLANGNLNTPVLRDFELKQNYPNPFNPTTTIAFKINLNGFHKVRLQIFDATGRLVGTLYNGLLERGSYRFKWNARNSIGQDVASGIYFYRLNVGKQAVTARMLLLR